MSGEERGERGEQKAEEERVRMDARSAIMDDET